MAVRLTPTAPFDLELSLRCLMAPPITVAARDWPAGAEDWNGRRYRRVVWLGERPLLLTLRNVGLVESPAVELQVAGATLSEAEQKAVEEIARHMLSAAVELAPFYAAARLDPVLADLREQYYGLKIIRFPSLYEALIATVLEQQLAPQFAAALRQRFLEIFGPRLEHEGRTSIGFPSPRMLAPRSPAELHAAGIPERKAAALLAIARAFLEGKVNDGALRAMPADGATEELCQLRGVGHWTAESSLLRGLGLNDVLPADDASLRKTAGLLYGLKTPATALNLRRRWKRLEPMRGYAAFYLWFTHWGTAR